MHYEICLSRVFRIQITWTPCKYFDLKNVCKLNQCTMHVHVHVCVKVCTCTFPYYYLHWITFERCLFKIYMENNTCPCNCSISKFTLCGSTQTLTCMYALIKCDHNSKLPVSTVQRCDLRLFDTD